MIQICFHILAKYHYLSILRVFMCFTCKIKLLYNQNNFLCWCRVAMNSLSFYGTTGSGVYPVHGVNSVLFDLRHQVAQQYQAYPAAAAPAAHTFSVAERLAGGSSGPNKNKHFRERFTEGFTSSSLIKIQKKKQILNVKLRPLLKMRI